MRGGGAKAVRNFSENSSDLVAGPFPKIEKGRMGKGGAASSRSFYLLNSMIYVDDQLI